mgnify:CR=1 FL=1
MLRNIILTDTLPRLETLKSAGYDGAELVNFGGERKLDRLFADTAPDVLGAELDTCWIYTAGVEQDEPSPGKTPMECALMSIAHLKTLI